MRLLADEHIPGLAVEGLRAAGHDVVSIAASAPGLSDQEVWRMARRERRVLLTFDKGFGDLVRHGPDDESYGVILFRKPVSTAVEASAWIVSMVTARDDWTGSFSVLERDKVRVRALQSFPPER